MQHLTMAEAYEYVDGEMSLRFRQAAKRHLAECDACRDTVAALECFSRSVELAVCEAAPWEDAALPGKGMAAETVGALAGAVRTALRERRCRSLLEQLNQACHVMPKHLQVSLAASRDRIAERLMATFTARTPRLAAVFGAGSLSVTRPYGLVRPPLTFRWDAPGAAAGAAAECRIRIENTNWELSTTEAELSVAREELGLEPGREYLWHCTVTWGDEGEETVSGFITVATREQEELLEGIAAGIGALEAGREDRLLLWASFLEDLEFLDETIEVYQEVYEYTAMPAIAYRIAACYDRLELDDLKQAWNEKIERAERA